MESSSEGRLGLQQVFPKNFLWKGKTFSEVTSLIRKNNNLDQTHYDHSIFFKSQPLKHYRREVATIDNVSNSRVMYIIPATITNIIGQIIKQHIAEGSRLYVFKTRYKPP